MYGSAFSADVEDARGFGWDMDTPRHDWSRLIAGKDAELDRLEGIYWKLLENAGADLIAGYGRLVGPHEVQVADRVFSAAHIVIAVGGKPQLIDVPGMAERAITSNEALDLAALPNEVVVYGGGYIALEFAGFSTVLAQRPHLVYRSDLPLRGFDDDIRREIAVALAGRGIILHPEKHSCRNQHICGSKTSDPEWW